MLELGLPANLSSATLQLLATFNNHNGLLPMTFIYRVIFCFFTAAYINSCATSSGSEPTVVETNAEQVIECTEPRPHVCTREYMPVCATKDTGIRCVTTPCPATENVTYANGCSACADPKVLDYIAWKCSS
jgi:hypothetical protein